MRDFTRVQYEAAIKRNSFRKEFMGYLHDPELGVSFGPVFNSDRVLNRRQTLARALRERREHERVRERDEGR